MIARHRSNATTLSEMVNCTFLCGERTAVRTAMPQATWLAA